MTEMKDSSGAAFPTGYDEYSGMSLRDYFAGHALAGVLANPARAVGSDVKAAPHEMLAAYAKVAYAVADAMIKERVS